MLVNKTVFDINGEKIGFIKKVIREKYEKMTLDFLVIEIERKVPWGYRDEVKVRTTDAKPLPDGNIKLRFTKQKIKIMVKEQELQKHPPTV
jgi:hypothetical protein